jgi:hypothetical protein
MRIIELLLEKPVQSSWIVDISHNRPNKTITMRLSNGRSYSIPGITRTTFEQWTRAPSKGRFFHRYIAGKFKATRIK